MKEEFPFDRCLSRETDVAQPGIYLADHRSVHHLQTLLRYRGLLRQLVIPEVKPRYKRSVLGFAWTVLNPLFAMAIFTMVFSNIFGNRPNYPPYVIRSIRIADLCLATPTPPLVRHRAVYRRIYEA